MSIRTVLIGTAATALALTACSSSKSGSSNTTLPPAGAQTSSGATTANAGKTTTISAANGVLLAPDGHTIYVNTVDTAGSIKCVGSCATTWPPVPGPVIAGGGVDAKSLGTTARPDGSLQATFDGHPLYEFTGDMAAGDKKGDGVADEGGHWEVATTSGMEEPSSSAASSSDSGGYGGY